MFQEFPKWIDVPGTEHGGVVVFSKEEENELRKEETHEEVTEAPKKRGRPKKGVDNGDQ